MKTSEILLKEKIISVTELQKNPTKALNAKIVRIVKNGEELGIFFQRQEFIDLMESISPLKASFQEEISALPQSPSLYPLAEL